MVAGVEDSWKLRIKIFNGTRNACKIGNVIQRNYVNYFTKLNRELKLETEIKKNLFNFDMKRNKKNIQTIN
jgi:hypothetical protein